MLDIELLRPLFRAAWGADTCDPDGRHEWRADNPARGQCGVTALVVQDLLGGELVLADVSVGAEKVGHHYWNRLPDGRDVDLTADQFRPDETVVGGTVRHRPPDAPRRCREEYERLRERIFTALPAEVAEADLAALVRSSEWLVGVLAAVRDEGLPSAWVGGGVLRDLVWGARYGTGFVPGDVRDVDVAYFDPRHLDRGHDDEMTARLARRRPDVPWEARNQAAVHTWYAAKFGGGPAEPLVSVHDAVATWPETATAVAVRLTGGDAVEVCAPCGLADLLGGVWRRNPRRVTVERSRERLARHTPAQRWPGVRVVPPDRDIASEP